MTSVSLANVNLSVNPVNGSNSLRFDRVSAAGENREEIHIRVSSSNGERFQVFQKMLEPLVNEKGEALNGQAIESQTLVNSNSAGTLYLQSPTSLGMGDQLVYSSSQVGESDSFKVGYSLNRSLINASGTFRGRLLFTVRGVGNAFSDQVAVDVFLQAAGTLKVAVKGNHHPSRINVKASDVSSKEADYVHISFSGNSNGEIRVYQELDIFPRSESGEDLGAAVLEVQPEAEAGALRMNGSSALISGRSLVYSSTKSEDDVLIHFLVNTQQFQQQEAGSYTGKIKYVVETNQTRQEFPMDIYCEVPPIFTMKVTMPPGGLNFPRVLVKDPPQEKEVMVTIVSNLHKPYQVVQDFQTRMTNNEGKEFDNKYFTLQVEIPAGQRGQTDFVEFSPVQTGEYPVFSSDAGGRGVTFRMLYRLQGYEQMSAGDFIAPIRLSLNQK